MARFLVSGLACAIAVVSGCDQASAPTPTVGCGAAITDRVDPRWRAKSVTRGDFGLYANAADIRTADRWGAVFWTKIPVIVAGQRAATLRVPARNRERIGLTYGPNVASPATSRRGDLGLATAPREVRFEPCADRATAAWPGGLALADRGTVNLEVRFDGGDWRALRIPGRG
jgi:hypothetical protein